MPQYVQNQIDWVREHARKTTTLSTARHLRCTPKRYLYSEDRRLRSLHPHSHRFRWRSDTINVSFEREPSETKTATPGWYNTMAFEKKAKEAGLAAESVFGDAFSDETKAKTATLIRKTLQKVDLVVYSLASPLRTDPATGVTYRSVLKPIGEAFTALSVDMDSNVVKQATIEAAEGSQAKETVKVMGGEDWALWIEHLLKEDLLAPNAMTVAYSYIGPKVTYPVYREGTIGMAKEHLEKSAKAITKNLEKINGKAFVSVNKALVTTGKCGDPVVPSTWPCSIR